MRRLHQTTSMALTLLLLRAAAGDARAQDVNAALARPISPGAIALLVEHTNNPAAQARLSGRSTRDRRWTSAWRDWF
jgi:hypothetical protein